MNATNHLESRVSATRDRVWELQDELHNGSPTPERAAEIRSLLPAAKDENNAASEAYDAAWRATLGPAALSEETVPGVGIVVKVLRASPMGGGSSSTIRPDDPGYDSARRAVASQLSQDERVARAAFALWGVDAVPVRIDYYGDRARVREAYPGKNCTPNPNGRKATVDTITMIATT